MLVLRINLPREKRDDKFDSLVTNLVNHINTELNMDEVRVLSDSGGVEITTKPELISEDPDEDEFIAIELMVSKNMVINNESIGDEEGLRTIKSELRKFVRS